MLDDRKPASAPTTPRPEEAMLALEAPTADSMPSAEQEAPGNVKGLFKQVGQRTLLTCHAYTDFSHAVLHSGEFRAPI